MSGLLVQHPEIALFIALAVGHMIGAVRVGPVQLGGVCGTLIVALLLGQTGVTLAADVKSVFFALFIFALGFTGGPQFFAHLATGWRFGMLSLVELIVVTVVVLVATLALSLNAGSAAGLLAGAATESAVIGTASEAISRLPLTASEVAALQGQIATAYSITYLFGLITIVLFTSQLAPLMLRINLRQSAADLAERMGQTEAKGASALPSLIGRVHRVGSAAGCTVGALEAEWRHDATIVRIRRAGHDLEPEPELVLKADDEMLLVGHREAIVALGSALGPDVHRADFDLPLISRSYILGRHGAVGATLQQVRALAPLALRRGVYIRSVRRLGLDVPLLPALVFQAGDIVELFGPGAAVNRAGKALGRPLESSDKTDFVMLGAGIFVGLLLGIGGVTLGGIHLTLGLGGGCLVSGLVSGWFSSRHPQYGTFPAPAAQILKDFGLAAFIAAVGFSAGPEAWTLMKEYGLWLPFAGVLAALLPATASLLIGHFLLKIEAPLLLGAIAGQQCSTPAISALTSAAGNATPVVGYTVTYAISNVLLPLLGPLVVSVVYRMT
ncbi:aspartate-alanine antiporter [Stenotrophomonas sp. NPDC077659]|uniref:aspartate-alanine antiporter n=1 Tax=Stenotrophomonas sp. NPDC077659 TaxID=3390694 RepID=UPI003CFC9AE6